MLVLQIVDAGECAFEDTLLGADSNTATAVGALIVVNTSQIVHDLNGFVGTFFFALLTGSFCTP